MLIKKRYRPSKHIVACKPTLNLSR